MAAPLWMNKVLDECRPCVDWEEKVAWKFLTDWPTWSTAAFVCETNKKNIHI